MQRKDRIDPFGALLLIGFALLFAFNQVIIKWTTAGLQPVFLAGLRSAGAVVLSGSGCAGTAGRCASNRAPSGPGC